METGCRSTPRLYRLRFHHRPDITTRVWRNNELPFSLCCVTPQRGIGGNFILADGADIERSPRLSIDCRWLAVDIPMHKSSLCDIS